MRTILLLPLAALITLLPALSHAQTCRDEDDRDLCRPQDIYLMPGAQAVTYAPAGAAPFVGAGVQIAPLQWSHNTNDFGPSQGAVYFQASLLRSQDSDATLAMVEGGGTLSFERNSSRGFMIPYFGATVGGLTHAELPDSAYAFPLLGLHAIYHPHVMLDLEGGYLFPFQELDTLRGPRGDLVMRVSLW